MSIPPPPRSGPATRPAPNTRSATISLAIARRAPPLSGAGLFTVPGRNDRYLGDLGFNWLHPLALPAACILTLLSPLLILWAGYVSVMRWLGRRHARRCNAAVFAASCASASNANSDVPTSRFHHE